MTEYIANSPDVGRRPRISRMRSYSSGLSPSAAYGCSRSGVAAAFSTVSTTGRADASAEAVEEGVVMRLSSRNRGRRTASILVAAPECRTARCGRLSAHDGFADQPLRSRVARIEHARVVVDLEVQPLEVLTVFGHALDERLATAFEHLDALRDRVVARVRQRDEVLHVADGHARRAQQLEELDPADVVLAVAAVSARRLRDRGEQSLALVIPQRVL